jgi:hypothetical protein
MVAPARNKQSENVRGFFVVRLSGGGDKRYFISGLWQSSGNEVSCDPERDLQPGISPTTGP